MSDRIAIMKDGEIVQIGTPHDIYNRPQTKFVAQFMGEVNTIEVERVDSAHVRNLAGGDQFTVTAEHGHIERGYLVVRPEMIKMGPSAEDLPNRVEGILANDYALGSRVQYQVRSRSDDYHWVVERLQDEPAPARLDEPVTIGWRPEDSILLRE